MLGEPVPMLSTAGIDLIRRFTVAMGHASLLMGHLHLLELGVW